MSLDHLACYKAISTRDMRFDGHFFTAVKTTGIYCRPVCPARTPMAQNVVFYPTAAAAQEAGFRPCLRCRPETAPDLGAWKGTSNTVSRALNMIEHGALDEGDVEALAARLGVGGRHLRRLFKQHLGATPVAVAQTRRVLLAKQLLQETQLSLANVAMAAGFGSIRRFNETFQALYNKPPGELRRESQKAKGELAIHSQLVKVKLKYQSPYDWQAMLAYFEARAIAGMEVIEEGRYARSFEIDGHQGVLIVSHIRDAFSVEVGCSDMSILASIIARVRRMLDLASDPSRIAADLNKDDLLAPLLAKRPGLRLPGAWDGYELAIRAILGQQITIAAARKLGARVTAEYGAALVNNYGVTGLNKVFPEAKALAEADLSGLPMPGARSGALGALSRAKVDNSKLFSIQANLEETIKTLTDLPGIGDWTAQYIAMRAMQEVDAFPAADAALFNAYEKLTGERLKAPELRRRAEAWRPWRAYATQHLWASLGD